MSDEQSIDQTPENSAGGTFEAPYPGSKEMPQWDTNELIDAPKFTLKNWMSMLGPGLIIGGAAIGGAGRRAAANGARMFCGRRP